MREEKLFFSWSGAILLLTASAKLFSAAGTAKVLAVQDEMLRLGYRPLMVSAALVEVLVAVFLFCSRNNLRRSLALFWLSSNFLVYHLGNYLLGFHACPCLGHVTDRLPLPPGLAGVILQVLTIYWSLRSLTIFWQCWGQAHWSKLLLTVSRRLHPASVRVDQV